MASVTRGGVRLQTQYLVMVVPMRRNFYAEGKAEGVYKLGCQAVTMEPESYMEFVVFWLSPGIVKGFGHSQRHQRGHFAFHLYSGNNDILAVRS